MSDFVLKYIVPPLFLLAMFGAVCLYAYWVTRFLEWFDRWRTR